MRFNIKKLKPFMFYNDLIISISRKYDAINTISTPEKEYKKDTCKIQPRIPFLIPTDNDKLFWIFYILRYSKDKYDFIKRTYQLEIRLKYKFIEKIQSNKDKLKANKIKRTNLANDLGNSSFISTETFIGLCCVCNINIILVKRTLMKAYLFDATSPLYHVIHVDNIQLRIHPVHINELQKNYISVVNLDKPLKSSSSYKVSELQTFAKRLHIDITLVNKKKTKKMLYEEIMERI